MRPERPVAGLVAVMLLAGAPAGAEERVLFGGLFDAEIHDTDDGSLLLARNDGDPAPMGRLRLWAAGEFTGRFHGFFRGELEAEKEDGEFEWEKEVELAFVRYTFRPPIPLTLEAGVLVTPIGNFPRRYLSSANPLIGRPDSYSVGYPLGIQAGGRIAAFDYRVAVVDKPLVNEAYVPQDPGSAARPALAFGITPVVGARIGAYATSGPYLPDTIGAFLPAGAGWKDFSQTVYGLDLAWSRGYFELNADFALSGYEVPAIPRDARGRAWFVEAKYTFTPRLFAAIRLERNRYPYIEPLGAGLWSAGVSVVSDAEVGAGWRLSPDAILKVAYRRDDWNVAAADAMYFPDGRSIAAQLSWTFDINSWFDRPR